jgi:hypothetical protein
LNVLPQPNVPPASDTSSDGGPSMIVIMLQKKIAKLENELWSMTEKRAGEVENINYILLWTMREKYAGEEENVILKNQISIEWWTLRDKHAGEEENMVLKE